AELKKILDMGGSVEALSYMKQQLVASNAQRFAAIEAGEGKVVVVNCFTKTPESPLTADAEGGILKIDPKAVEEKVRSLQAFRAKRNKKEVEGALAALKQAARGTENIMPAS